MNNSNNIYLCPSCGKHVTPDDINWVCEFCGYNYDNKQSNIEQLSPQEIALDFGYENTIKEYPPRSSCQKCYGRGYIGIEVESGELYYCNCVLNKIDKAVKAKKAEEKKLTKEIDVLYERTKDA